MKRINLSDLTPSELERIQKTIQRRFRIGQDSNLLQLGYGIAESEKQKRLDLDRPMSICFYVRRKFRPRKRIERIPSQLQVRIKRGSTFCLLIASTDVLVVKKGQLRLSGRSIRYSSNQSATTGVMIVWNSEGQSQLNWGLITVGHTFPSNVRLPDQEINVQIGPSPSIPGRFIASGTNKRIDASLTLVKKTDLIRSGLISPGFNPNPLAIRSLGDLQQDIGEPGTSWPRDVGLSFQVLRYLISAPIFQGLLGFVPKNVLHVGQSVNGTFRPGTSGSLWEIQEQASCVQFGAYRPQFSEAFGQSLASIIEWAVVATGGADVRVVKTF